MRSVGIRELKSRLSAFLREVSRGESLLITDRGRVVAELRPPEAQHDLPFEARRQRLIERGILKPPTAPEEATPVTQLPTLSLRAGTVDALLAAERQE